jgi:hypothetical protein
MHFRLINFPQFDFLILHRRRIVQVLLKNCFSMSQVKKSFLHKSISTGLTIGMTSIAIYWN